MSDFWIVRAATTAFAYVFALGFLLLFAVVLIKLYKSDLESIILEKDSSGKSSIARFQLLVFTLTIAGLYIILSIEAGTLIDVPSGALTLLGLSGGSFLISKGIGTPRQRTIEKQLEVEKEVVKTVAGSQDRQG
jgi:hypothetical protein